MAACIVGCNAGIGLLLLKRNRINMRTVFIIVFSMNFFFLHAQEKKSTLSGENNVTLDGENLHNVQCNFNKNTSGWYIKGPSLFANIELDGKVGNADIRMFITIDGSTSDKTFDISRFSDASNQGNSFVLYYDPHSNTYGDDVGLRASEDHHVHVQVNAVDEQHLQLQFHGNLADGRKNFSIHGKVSLAQQVTGMIQQAKETYKDCDNTIYDKLAGSQFRSPTDCEVKFDLALRNALHEAFQPAIIRMAKDGWQVENETEIKPITGIGRHTENNPFIPGFTTGGNYKLHLQLSPSADSYQKLKKQNDDAMADMQKDPNSPDAMKKFSEALEGIQGASDITINVNINESNSGVTNFTTEHSIEKAEGVAYILHLRNAQATTGGGKEGSSNTSFIYLGKWNAPTFEKRSDGSEKVTCSTIINKSAPHLAVQNIVMRITCNNELAGRLAKFIDFNRLNAMILK